MANVSLSPCRGSLTYRRQVMLIKRLAGQRFDHGLTADVQFLCCVVQLLQHRRGEIHIDPLDRRHHTARIHEKTRDVFSIIRKTRDGFRRYRFPLFTNVLHKVVAPASLLSTASRGGNSILLGLPALQKSARTIFLPPSRWRGTVPADRCVGQVSGDARRSPAPPQNRSRAWGSPLTVCFSAHRSGS